MSEIENKINQLAEKLINLFQDSPVSFKRNNLFSYMTVSFYYKQRYHLINLFKLNESYDLELICRCMIEGMAVLYHGQNDSEFVSRWVQQGDIEDLKMLEDKEKNGFYVSEEQKQYIIQRVNEVPHLLRKPAKNDIEQKNRSLKYSDFEHHKIPMKTLVKDLSKEAGYWNDVYSVYDRFSKWQHWNPAGISQFVKLDKDDIKFIENYPLRLTTLTYGIFCLIQTSKIFDQVFALGYEEELLSLEKQMVSIFGEFTEDP